MTKTAFGKLTVEEPEPEQLCSDIGTLSLPPEQVLKAGVLIAAIVLRAIGLQSVRTAGKISGAQCPGDV